MFNFNIKEVEAAEVQSRFGEGVKLIDVRSGPEVAQGAIPGAIHIPLETIPTRAGDIPTDEPVVIYCRSGNRSAQAVAFLQQQGFGNLYNLRGGIAAWVQGGRTVA